MQDESKQRAVALYVAKEASTQEREALLFWLLHLVAIRKSDLTVTRKAYLALKFTLDSQMIWPMIKLVGTELKRIGWDERGIKSKAAIAASGTAIALFGTQGAGIAALGGAIGVPLWVVFGAGVYFAATLIEELLPMIPKSVQERARADIEEFARKLRENGDD